MRKSWKRLAIDTATKYVYLSLIIDDHEVANVYQEGINNHSVTIIPFLVKLLKSQELTLKDINEVIIGIGPGSYTGVRIGVSIAKMIGYLNNIEVKTVSSLALMASSSEAEVVVSMIDARRSNAFLACFKQSNGRLEYIKEDRLAKIDDFLSELDIKYDTVTDGLFKIEKIIKSGLMNPVDDIHALVPNYLQVTEAERNKGL